MHEGKADQLYLTEECTEKIYFMGRDPFFKVDHLNFAELQIQMISLPCHNKALRVYKTSLNTYKVSFTHAFLSLRLQRGLVGGAYKLFPMKRRINPKSN